MFRPAGASVGGRERQLLGKMENLAGQPGCEADQAGDELAAGVRMISAGFPEPGLVLLDLNLPRRDGLEVLAEIRADAGLGPNPVVMLTTSQAPDDILRSKSAARRRPRHRGHGDAD